MSDTSKESREDALERILAETAKNPYVPKRPIRPAQPSVYQPKNTGNAEKRPSGTGTGGKNTPQGDGGIPVTRVLTEAQKAELAKARAAQKVEEIKRIRQQREAEEKLSLRNYAKIVQAEAENAAETLSDSDVKIRKAPKNDTNLRDDGLWDPPDARTAANAAAEMRTSIINTFFSVVECLIVIFLIILWVRTYVFQMAVVDGTSMNPTLNNSDKLIIRSIGYSPEIGDVVVIRSKNAHLISENGKVVESEGIDKDIVKRVIASGGQTIDINFENGDITVDGKLLKEKYISEPTTRDEHAFTYPLKVPEGYIFVMGDNRNISMDSRHPQIGLVPEENVTGKVVFRIYPIKKLGGID